MPSGVDGNVSGRPRAVLRSASGLSWLAIVLIGLLSILFALPTSARASVDPTDIWANQPHGPDYTETAPPMDETVRARIGPQMEHLLKQLLRERRKMMLGGIKVFESGDKFLPGKIAMAMAYRVTLLSPGDLRRRQTLKDFADIATLTIDDPNESWGIYYYLSALYSLKQQGLLEQAIPSVIVATLRARLDWRRFVRTSDLTLIDLPNNYYGVAFSVARLRYLLGWEDAAAGDALLARTLDHYRKYSGEFGFADETDGDGRFDRYSVLLIGEIAQRMVETGVEPSVEVRHWLRRSVELLLPRFNLNGEGFEYGRSIGPYGETLFLEVLKAAARLKILSPTEERMAYAMSCRVAARYMDFWVNSKTGSVDMWSNGRRTDEYRGPHRIFGENLSLARQYFYTNEIWNGIGYRGSIPDPGYARWLATLPALTTTWFARGQYDRALVTIRDDSRVIGLPIINGADLQHMNNPYFPVPFSPGMLQGAADAGYPQLLPRVTLADGSVLMPLAYFKNITVRSRRGITEVKWRQDTVDRMGAKAPIADRRLTFETRYSFLPGRIERFDRIIPARGVAIRQIDLEFASFSSHPKTFYAGISFQNGEVRTFAAKGYGPCHATEAIGPEYRSTTGRFKSLVRCTLKRPLAESKSYWTLTYQR